jgi:hypothetical protein
VSPLPGTTVPPEERAVYAAVDEALRTQPLRPAPDLSGLVMARITTGPARAAARPVFRLSWMDYAISGFAGLMVMLALLIWRRITPEFAMLVWNQVSGPAVLANWLVWVLALAGLLMALGLVALGVLVFRPRSSGFQRI